MQKYNTLEQLFFVVLVSWIVGYGVAHLVKQRPRYEAWTKKQLNGLWNNHWKFFIGVLVGYILTTS